MQCLHCLRGAPQNKSMKRETLRLFLSQINYISSVTFTGGEPTLPSGIKAMRDFMEICNHYRIPVGSFYFVTNGKKWRPEILKLVRDLYNFCDDNEASSIEISNDQFHVINDISRQDFRLFLQEELEYNLGVYDLVGMRGKIHHHQLVRQGRTDELKLGGSPYRVPDISIEMWNDNTRVVEGDIYLNCDGNVIAGCDWSYKSQNEPDKIICSASDDFKEAVVKFTRVTETKPWPGHFLRNE